MTQITLHEGDNRESLRRLINEGVRVHSVVTDPPYGLVSVQKRFGKEGSAAARTEGNDGSFARLSGGFMGKCFHPDTEIMTTRGWKRVDQIEVGEVVATLDPQSRDLVWQAVEQCHAYPFEGELVHIKHRSSEQLITPNHKMLVSFDGGQTLKLAEAGDLKTHFHIFAQANPSSGKTSPVAIESEREYGKDRSERRIERETFDANAFFRFFGLWLGDGYTCSRSSDHPANDFFGINVKKGRKKDAVRQALLSLGVKFTETVSDNGFSAFYVYNFALLGWLKQFGKAADKFIPDEFFEWDASCLEELYRGLIETDGTVQGQKGQEVFFTASRRLAEDFQRLCLQVGRSASVCFKPGGKSVTIQARDSVTSDSWTCCVLQTGKRMYGEKSLSSSNVVFDYPYVGNVFCVGVPEHHVIYTRFNGKPVWTGNSWDGTGIERDPEFWRLIWEILLPGGYCFAFSGSRTGHWQAVAMEQAGFVMHPMHAWVYGSGFPKAVNAARSIDKAARGVLGKADPDSPNHGKFKGGCSEENARGQGFGAGPGQFMAEAGEGGRYEPKTPEAAQWEGWAYGTQAQKPALEPIYLGQKPFSEKTGAANLLKHGVGAVNIDGCRVPTGENLNGGAYAKNPTDREAMWGDEAGNSWRRGGAGEYQQPEGRHPANLILDGSPEVVALFPDSKSTGGQASLGAFRNGDVYGKGKDVREKRDPGFGDSGSAARFFHNFQPDPDPIIYQPKAGKLDRAGSVHPTVKPVALMQYLVRHITPPGGVVLDPFAGSGTTAEAARREGFDCILMEAEPEYIDFLRSRFGLGDHDLADLLGDAKETDWGQEKAIDPLEELIG